ncbi:tetraketide alpha-pyrone reductase 1-like, partial [Phalaenopsis equestris]|uniref:tetraketide alpha-pyrone reductase 1-like n=1 Tax=Phalaenopsis equestris TaxID=78828 RepID=UPI0009E576FE
AFKYAQENGLDVVTICPSICIGPLLQPTVNTSSLFLINILNGTSEYIEKIHNWHFVDVRDVTDAALLIFEKEASGRYICTLDPIYIVDLLNLLKKICPGFKHFKNNFKPGVLLNASSEKLKKIGWNCRPLSDSISVSVQYYEETGILSLE